MADPLSDPSAPWPPNEVTPTAPPSPGAPPGGAARPATLLPTHPSDPLYDAYRDENHPGHREAVATVHARFQEAHGGPEPWRDDGLERPGPAEARAPYVLLSPHPHSPLPPDTLTAVSNAFDAIVGSKALAQAALDYLEGGPADRLPELPPSYQPPDPSAALSELRRGWGAKAEENLRLAQAVVDVYDRQKGGAVREYLNRTGLGNDPRVIRLATRTARQWIKEGWRP
jgi:hypothetical protein